MEKQSLSFDTQVCIIGSGFGASVAALRFAEAGYSVTVLERGDWIRRETFEADGDLFWDPDDEQYGMNELRPRGRTIIPWLGAGVGGGSHVYAGTLKRREFFDDFPSAITVKEMEPFYEEAECMMGAVHYPDYPPYGQLEAYELFRRTQRKMQQLYPELVEEQGSVPIGISFAPPGGQPGATFTNKFGARQRYSEPLEQHILGGDIDVKNTLDKNYLFVAQQRGAQIESLTEADKIERLDGGGYRVHFRQLRSGAAGSLTCRHLILGAGAIGSTELLLRNKQLHKTLPDLSDQLGERYFSNGDYLGLLIPKRGLPASWLGLALSVVALIQGWYIALIVGIGLYAFGYFRAAKSYEPDLGTTNSDYIRFRHRDGSTQGSYIEGGRYPTLIRAGIAVVMSLLGQYHPAKYKGIVRRTRWLRYVPVLELIDRSWPIPMLMMGRDDAVGRYTLNAEGRAEISYDLSDNHAYYRWMDTLARRFCRLADAYFVPNMMARIGRFIEVPHNLGGVPMGESKGEGVVDDAGRVYGYPDLMVLDGSIIPVTLGPNPALTILALAERGAGIAIRQLREADQIEAGSPVRTL